jgi:hypothetical protein
LVVPNQRSDLRILKPLDRQYLVSRIEVFQTNDLRWTGLSRHGTGLD